MDDYYSTSEDEWESLTTFSTPCNDNKVLYHNDTENETYVARNRKNISWIVWMAMKIACVFYESELVVERKCFHCQIRKTYQSLKHDSSESSARELLDKAIDVSGQGYYKQKPGSSHGLPHSGIVTSDHNQSASSIESDSQSRCDLCDSYWWNFDGKTCLYRDNDIGSRPWNHRGSWFFSVVGIFGSIAVIGYDAIYYLGNLWGQQSQIIHLISYGTFMLNLMLYPLLIMICKFRAITQRRVPQISWSTGLSGRYLVKRFQYLDIPNRGAPGKALVFFGLLGVVFHTVYRGKFYLVLCHRFSFHSGLSVICGGVILTMFVAFQYLMYLTRLSFQRHFALVVNLIRARQGDLDICRHIVGSAFQDFNCFRKLIAIYMNLLIPVLTWAITTHVAWQYYLNSNEQNDRSKSSQAFTSFETRINILIWLEIVMFLVIPIWAIGGLDTSYIWTRFRLRVLTIPRRASDIFWRKLIRHMDAVNEHYDRINFTMIFSIIGFFMALEFGNNQTTTFVIPEPYCDNASEIVFGPLT